MDLLSSVLALVCKEGVFQHRHYVHYKCDFSRSRYVSLNEDEVRGCYRVLFIPLSFIYFVSSSIL